MNKFRKGDRVSIEGVIATNYVLDGGTIKVTVEPYHEIFVNQADLTMVRPTFETGDKVEWSTHCGADVAQGHVLSIANEHLWVDMGAGSFATVSVDNARRVDPEPAVEPAPVEDAA